jgi:hypothetical protein
MQRESVVSTWPLTVTLCPPLEAANEECEAGLAVGLIDVPGSVSCRGTGRVSTESDRMAHGNRHIGAETENGISALIAIYFVQ